MSTLGYGASGDPAGETVIADRSGNGKRCPGGGERGVGREDVPERSEANERLNSRRNAIGLTTLKGEQRCGFGFGQSFCAEGGEILHVSAVA